MRHRPIAATLAIAVVAGVGAVSVLPGIGMTAVAEPAAAQQSVALAAGGQDLAVAVTTEAAAEDDADAFGSVSVQQQREEAATSYRAQYASLQRSVADDYPFKDAGYGQSALGYALRNCTDFVAWRLNRDAGALGSPWLLAWSYLTPLGGDARQWRANWVAKGWLVSKTPVVGAVAWFGGENHVAYVARVNGDGTVLLEEYNYGTSYRYGTRTVAASSVGAFLYPPPLPGASG